MGSKSSTSGHSDTGEQSNQGSVSSKNVSSGQRGRIQLSQNVLLIWLDRNIDENNPDCWNTTTQLRRVINTINKYTETAECIEFLKTIDDEKACMIISGSLGQEIVPQIHKMRQVNSIFIFCQNEDFHKTWAKNWTKIKGVFKDISLICDALRQAAQQCERNAMVISFVPTNTEILNTNLDKLDSSFMYTLIFKEILLTIQFEKEHFKEFIAYCYEKLSEIEEESKNIKILEERYKKKTPVWWYTYECFLYKMLNRGLRTMDVDVIVKMGFFIRDLHRHIEQLHSEQFKNHHSNDSFTVYRGQGISHVDLAQLTQTKGGLMSFNSFLSTSKNQTVSLQFAQRSAADPDLVGILFVMKIDPSKSTTPFISVADVSAVPAEDEVLFSTNTVFRIYDVKPLDQSYRLFQVDLTLTSNNDKDLCALTNYLRKDTEGPSGWYRLGELLRRLGQHDKAQVTFINQLNRGIDDNEKAAVFNQLGMIKHIQGEPKGAIAMYEKSLEIYGKADHSNDRHLAWSFNNIALVYQNTGEYVKALSFHAKALEIRERSLASDHVDIASSYNNIGALHAQMHVYDKALFSFQKAHEMKKKTLPAHHPELAYSYDNIGSVYSHMGNDSKALSYHEKAYEIFLRTLPVDHPDLAISYSNIAVAYENMGEYSKARSFYEKAVDLGQRVLPSDHSGLCQWQKSYEKIKK